MKSKKTFIAVCLLTFVVSFSVTYSISKIMERIRVAKTNNSDSLINENEFEIRKNVSEDDISNENLEIFEEVNDRISESVPYYSVKLLESGEGFHGDEIYAKSGEIWLGLFKNSNRFFLKNSVLRIRKAYDPIVDDGAEENPKQKTGKTVSVEGKIQPVYLFKNASMLREGEVETLFGGNTGSAEIEEDIDYISLRSGFSREYTVGTKKYSIKVKKGVNKQGQNIIALILENGNINQVLYTSPAYGDDDYAGTVYWIGDLDRDGKLDIIAGLYVHENVENRSVFLSSQAEKGKLVKKVADFSTTGC